MERNPLKATVLILTIGRDEEIKNLIKDLEGQKYVNFDIYIVYQGKNRNLENNIVKKSLFKIVYTEKQQFTKLLNITINNIHSDIIIRIDDDVRISNKNFIYNHVKNYSNAKIGAVQGQVINKEESVSKNKKTGIFSRLLKIQTKTNYNSDKKQYINALYGCNFSFRKDLFIKGIKFNEKIIGNNYFEETDFGLKIVKYEYKIIFEPNANLKHLQSSYGGARLNDKKRWFYYYSYNYIQLINANYSAVYLLQAILIIIGMSILISIKNFNFNIGFHGIKGISKSILSLQRRVQL